MSELEEDIKHCEEVLADWHGCDECKADHERLLSYMKELLEYRKSIMSDKKYEGIIMDAVIGKLKEELDNLKEENRILKIQLSLTNSILEEYETNISANNLAKDIQNKLEDKEIDKYTPVITLKDKKYIVGINTRVCHVSDLAIDSLDKGYDCEDVTQRYAGSHTIVVLEPRKCRSDEDENYKGNKDERITRA